MENLLIDPVDPILRLERDARAAPDRMPVPQALRPLERRRPVEPVARVDDDAGLVGPQIGADAREGAREGRDDGVARRVGGSVDEPVAVVTFALGEVDY